MNPRTLYLIKRAEIEVTSQMMKVLAPFGITPSQFTILYFVDHYQGNLSSAQLSRRFSMKPQSMNQLVGVLERKMLLEKVANPDHGRILHLQLSEAGKELLQACNLALDGLEEHVLKNMSFAENQVFRNFLGTILDSSAAFRTIKPEV